MFEKQNRSGTMKVEVVIMGSGKMYTCKTCGNTYQTFLGLGFGFEEEYKKHARQMSKGKAGEEIQEIFNSEKKIALNVDNVLYQCEKCGYWNVEPKLDIFEVIKPEKYENSHVYGLKNVLIVTPGNIKGRDFKILRRFNHWCCECGKKMSMVDMKQPFVLKCPDCKGEMYESGWIDWD